MTSTGAGERDRKREALFVLDLTTGSLHLRTCGILLASDGHDLVPFRGLEHALCNEPKVRWCGCACAFVLKSTAGIFDGLAAGDSNTAPARWAAQFRKAADLFERHATASSIRHVKSDGPPN